MGEDSPSVLDKFKAVLRLNSINIHSKRYYQEIYDEGKLKTFNLTKVLNNKFQTPPEQLYQLQDLQYLNLSENNLKSIKSEIEELQNLRELNLANNMLEDLPQEIQELKFLEQLILRNNNIDAIDFEELADNPLPCLRKLDLSYNLLQEIPEFIFQLNNLEEINLSHNNFEQIPDEIWKLPKLKKLSIKSNAITQIEIAKSNQKAEQLLFLDLSFNKISDFTYFNMFPRLLYLNLTGNKLNWLPDQFGSMPRLIALLIGKNKLQEIPVSIARLKQLQTFDIKYNSIEYVDEKFITTEITTMFYDESIKNGVSQKIKNWLESVDHNDNYGNYVVMMDI